MRFPKRPSQSLRDTSKLAQNLLKYFLESGLKDLTAKQLKSSRRRKEKTVKTFANAKKDLKLKGPAEECAEETVGKHSPGSLRGLVPIVHLESFFANISTPSDTENKIIAEHAYIYVSATKTLKKQRISE